MCEPAKRYLSHHDGRSERIESVTGLIDSNADRRLI